MSSPRFPRHTAIEATSEATAQPRSAPSQLVLNFAVSNARGPEDLFVGPANASAVAFIDRWPDWPGPSAYLQGGEGAGKSHLANVWAVRSGAATLQAPALCDAAIALFEAKRALVVEDLHAGVPKQKILFHLLNLARETTGNLLLTSRAAPGELTMTLPDLASRLKALPLVVIAPPDEALLAAILVKLFADRQLEVEPPVVAYLARHLERSMGAAQRVVAEADRLALALQRKVTRAVASAALQAIGVDHVANPDP